MLKFLTCFNTFLTGQKNRFIYINQFKTYFFLPVKKVLKHVKI